jgi:hypothetical protein
MVIKWTAEANNRLFMLIIKEQDIKVDAKRIAAAYGEGLTEGALRFHLGELRKKAAKMEGGGDNEQDGDNGTLG